MAPKRSSRRNKNKKTPGPSGAVARESEDPTAEDAVARESEDATAESSKGPSEAVARVSEDAKDATAESSEGTDSHKLLKYIFKGEPRCMICDGPGVPSALTAIFNMILTSFDAPGVVNSHLSAQAIRDIVKDHLAVKLKGCNDSGSIKDALNEVIQSLGPAEHVMPILKRASAFKENRVTRLFKHTGVPLLHGWLLHPEEDFYESVKDYSHTELQMYVNSLKDDLSDVAEKRRLLRLLLDLKERHTWFGYNTISSLMNEGFQAVLYWDNKFHLIYYAKEVRNLLLLETDPDIVNIYPDARWRVFQKEDAERIYLDDKLGPAANQPDVGKARAWHDTMISKTFEDEPRKLTKSQRKRERERQKNLQKNAEQKKDSNVALEHQRGNNQAAKGGIPVPSNAQADDPPSDGDQRENNQAAADENIVLSTNVGQPDSPTSEKGQGVIQDATLETLEAPNIAEPGSSASEKDQVGDGQAESSSKDQHKSTDADEFLEFLKMFRDDDGVLYFEGVAAGMKHTGSSKFRVPFDFIKAHNNKLAITICESYHRISNDLTQSVCDYLKYLNLKGVDIAVDIAVKLHIQHLPERCSYQTFLNFVENMEFVEKYDVFSFVPVESESPTFIARNMALGYLHSIIEKFREGRCFDGKWDESRMMVKMVKESACCYEINCEDVQLTAEAGFRDLDRFDKVVIQRFKSKDGKLPPYFEELQQDFKLIRKYFVTMKWDRFLLLISYPLALKAPLVRSSLIQEMYQSADSEGSECKNY